MKKNYIFLLAALLVSVAVIFLIWDRRDEQVKKEIFINGRKFTVELADGPKKRALGLGGRGELCLDCGMVFLFDTPGRYPFWMKDMKFPLDIIWADEGKIVFLKKNVAADYKEIVAPSAEANAVLEINAGLADKYGIKEGDKVKF